MDELADWLERHGHPPWIAIDDCPMGTPEAQEHRVGTLMDGHFVNSVAEEGLSEEMYRMAEMLLAVQSGPIL